MSTPLVILALDPGREKCGAAVARLENSNVEILAQRIVATDDIENSVRQWLEKFPIQKIVIGDATTSRALRARLSAWLAAQSFDVPIETIEERGSTLEARALYWQANPPRGWRRVLPLSLQAPPEPLDDFAAVILARRFFGVGLPRAAPNPATANPERE